MLTPSYKKFEIHVFQRANMRISKIPRGAEYRMDEQFQKFAKFSNFNSLSNWKNSKNF